jgi:hypothetical protein
MDCHQEALTEVETEKASEIEESHPGSTGEEKKHHILLRTSMSSITKSLNKLDIMNIEIPITITRCRANQLL